jgi:hypothetical protein
MNHHKFPTVFGNPPPVGEPHESGGLLLYDREGLFDGLYDWDTTGLTDGVHVLFLQTTSTQERGTSIGGLKLLFKVDNGNPRAGSEPDPVPDPDPEPDPEPDPDPDPDPDPLGQPGQPILSQ